MTNTGLICEPSWLLHLSQNFLHCLQPLFYHIRPSTGRLNSRKICSIGFKPGE